VGSDANPDLGGGTAGPPSSPRPSFSRILHYVVGAVLAAAALAYWALKPPTLNPMADPRAAEAMALVQTHRAEHAPTLRQALTERVQGMEERGIGVRMGEWQVEHQQGDLYLVKVFVREQGTRQWFEREYIWQVNLAKKAVVGITLPAIDLMPADQKGPSLAPPGIPSL
jgi:hypothetical protein